MTDPHDPSWWFADAMAREAGAPAPSLMGEITVDVAIVGGGYTGLWTALALKARKPGLSVAVIEASLCGSGASGKNGGKIHGYWASLQGMSRNIGEDGALGGVFLVDDAGFGLQHAPRLSPLDTEHD